MTDERESIGLGVLRRSVLVSTHGPGAMVDYLATGGGAVSGVTLGLDAWKKSDCRRIVEPSVERLLGIDELREPPVSLTSRQGEDTVQPSLPAARFPDWLECPTCEKLRPSRRWSTELGRAGLFCRKCRDETSKPSYVVPARFVVTCENGHLSDFPWMKWIDHKSDCAGNDNLKLNASGAGLRGLFVNCLDCGEGKGLRDAFISVGTVQCCAGERPWLGAAAVERCAEPPKTLQRGASNTYFPHVASVLTIPPWTEEFQSVLVEGGYWERIEDARSEFVVDGDSDAYERDLRKIARKLANDRAPESSDIESWLEKIRAYLRAFDSLPDGDDAQAELALRREEWRQFRQADRKPDRTFEVRDEPVPASLSQWFQAFARVPRLREVKALRGFTRLVPPDGTGTQTLSPIALRARWRPAMETLGEGVFVALREEAVEEWESKPEVKDRAKALNENWIRDWQSRFDSEDLPPMAVTARLLLVHSFSHALMQELSLTCGYGSSSLAERLYVAGTESELPMAGVLIYTASSDADGTLGGLEREGQSAKLEQTIRRALNAMHWCSSDPLCLRGISTTSDDLNGAACHSCLFLPETSCEMFNRTLDRVTLVGTVGENTSAEVPGFFFNSGESLTFS